MSNYRRFEVGDRVVILDGPKKNTVGDIIWRGPWKKDGDYDEVRIKYGPGRIQETVTTELWISLLVPVLPLKKQLADVGVTLV